MTTQMIPITEGLVERLCHIQHDAYESAAISAGWTTNPDSRRPWEGVPEANKITMRSSMRAVLASINAMAGEANV